MKLITRFLYLSAAGIMLLTSCAKEQTESYDKFENQALEAWMTQNRRELLKNYQPRGQAITSKSSLPGIPTPSR